MIINYKLFIKNIFTRIYKNVILSIHFSRLEELDSNINRIDKVSSNYNDVCNNLINKNSETIINNSNKIYEIMHPNVKAFFFYTKRNISNF